MPFYDPKKMKRALAGATYSTSEGVWATGERMLFGIIDKPAGTGSRPHRRGEEKRNAVKGTVLLPRGKGTSTPITRCR